MLASAARALGWIQLPADMSGKLAVVTGGNSGIGLEVAAALAARGATVVSASRSMEHLRQGIAEVARRDQEAAKRVRPVVCDLESLASVRAAAERVRALGRPIDALVLCAGRFLDAPFALTADGIEQVRAANFFGHALLTLLLLDRVIAAGPARIVSVVSFGEIGGRVRLGDLTGAESRASGLGAYCDAKLMLYVWASELQARLRRAGARVDCFATQPGWVASPLMAKASSYYPLGAAARLGARFFALPPRLGCRSTLFAAADPSLTGAGVGARSPAARYFGAPYPLFWLPWLLHTASGAAWNPQAHDDALRAALWDGVRGVLTEAGGGGGVVPDLRVELVPAPAAAPEGSVPEKEE